MITNNNDVYIISTSEEQKQIVNLLNVRTQLIYGNPYTNLFFATKGLCGNLTGINQVLIGEI
ncbi:MAG: hypothetical protein US50_C0030G0003 [Candidatus Nomurabacteria bacterium GW2011_GWB1_37_5]|uniref:Uncharacterized protein n=1 Tax=Candidatus Nomurabacteria bacterium GW2011_GWB1_37_5 TaxID=1618742 RepID=A0A0G0K2S2_9BACT|nr:MAG: hypothetical protein US50_C0030G0003 [Candidatus Nomurabacteria bacterium GW2011_GWB1_37_5]